MQEKIAGTKRHFMDIYALIAEVCYLSPHF